MKENNYGPEMNALVDRINDLFEEFMCDMVDYSVENLKGANIWDVYSAIVVGFTLDVYFDEVVTEEDLLTLSKELVYFGNKYKVKEVGPIVDEIKHIIDNKLYKKNK